LIPYRYLPPSRTTYVVRVSWRIARPLLFLYGVTLTRTDTGFFDAAIERRSDARERVACFMSAFRRVIP
jgi:hypothetical protein